MQLNSPDSCLFLDKGKKNQNYLDVIVITNEINQATHISPLIQQPTDERTERSGRMILQTSSISTFKTKPCNN